MASFTPRSGPVRKTLPLRGTSFTLTILHMFDPDQGQRTPSASMFILRTGTNTCQKTLPFMPPKNQFFPGACQANSETLSGGSWPSLWGSTT